MNEQEFWNIIESSGSPDSLKPDEQCAAISVALSSKSKEDIVEFHNIHLMILNKAYTWNLLEACYIVIHHASDDVFEDFRNWIILNGRERFERSLENPDYLASFIKVDDPVEEITGEALLYVCEEAFEGEAEELEELYKYPVEPVIEDSWPPVAVLKEKYPNLFSKYWDDSVKGMMSEASEAMGPTAFLVAENLMVSIPDDLDFTHQIIEHFDTKEPVLASWNGDELEYFVAFQKLPPGWLDAKKWINGYKRSMKVISKFFSFKTIAEGDVHPKPSDYAGMYCEIEFIQRGDTDVSQQVVYFIANKESSYIAVASPTQKSTKEIRIDMNRVIETVSSAENVVTLRSKQASADYTGIWHSEYLNNKSESIDVLLLLDQDTTFKFRERLENSDIVSPYTGAWYEASGKLFCAFMYSKPHTDRFRRYGDEEFSVNEHGQLIMSASDRGAQLVFTRMED
jgi:hypothetical protein